MDLSVVMPVYNQPETLESAITSLLTQSFSDFELMIIDDHSTDETIPILNRFKRQDKRVKIITNRRHLGLTKSLNLGIKAVKTKLIARMDADDIALPKRLEKQRQYLLTHPKIGLLGTAAKLIDTAGQSAGVRILPVDSQGIRRQILSFCPFIHPTWMLPRKVWLELNGYNEAFPFAQDYELALRIAAKYPTANLAETLLMYRVNNPAAISLKQLKQHEKLAIKARWLALTRYGYSWNESWRIIKPALSFLVPAGIKKLVYEKIYWSNRRSDVGRLVN